MLAGLCGSTSQPWHHSHMDASVGKHLHALETVCRNHGIRRLDLFGSAARGDADAQSDLDFLVDLGDLPPARYAATWFSLKSALENLFGRPVDLLTPYALANPYFRARVEHERVALYPC